MSLSSLVSATETAVRLSEAALVAAEEAMVAVRLVNIHATSAMATAKLAQDLERRMMTRGEEAPGTISLPAILIPGSDLLGDDGDGDGAGDSPVDPKDVSKDDNNNQDLVEQSAEKEIEHMKAFHVYEEADIIDIEDEDEESMDENEVIRRISKETVKKKTKDTCRNCKQLKKKCLNGRLVLNVTQKTFGMKVIGCSDQTFFLGKVGTVIGGSYGNIKIRWNSGSYNSYTLHCWGQFSFKFFCEDPGNIEDKSRENVDELRQSPDWLVVERLSVDEVVSRVWTHDQSGEKHRIRICASEKIIVKGVGLRVKSPISRVTLHLCQETELGKTQKVIFKQDFVNVSWSVLQLKHGVPLSCDRRYGLVLTLHGGASYVGAGGEEFVSVNCPGRGEGERQEEKEEVEEVLFKFEDYKDQTDKPAQTTTVSVGLVDKIYFELHEDIPES